MQFISPAHSELARLAFERIRTRRLDFRYPFAVAAAVLLCATLALSVPATRDHLTAAIAHDEQLRAVLTTMIVFCAALISSVAGFAFSALAGAGLTQVQPDPVHAMGVLLACSIAIQAVSVWQIRRSVRWDRLRPFVWGGVPGVLAGAWLLTVLVAGGATRLYSAGLGLFLIGYGAYMMLRRSDCVFRGTAPRDMLAGLLGGLTGGLAAFPGSFVTIWCGMRGWDKNEQRAVFQPFILGMQVLALLALQRLNPTIPSLGDFAVYVPAAVFATFGGLAIFERLSNRHFNMLVYGLLFVSGLALTAKLI